MYHGCSLETEGLYDLVVIFNNLVRLLAVIFGTLCFPFQHNGQYLVVVWYYLLVIFKCYICLVYVYFRWGLNCIRG